ncbi:MAG: hypothetical protein Q9161_005006 [Pseudevernia consocians]
MIDQDDQDILRDERSALQAPVGSGNELGHLLHNRYKLRQLNQIILKELSEYWVREGN